ncbi:hypothetical protein CUJ84_Chr002781 [Rhizobium leguminosarum]|uniref:Uncharacterized protein n=1 Tax=Rhizobium leguminosarum TaxID=384 RepID=A0A2K9Z4L6_RHILE|nr:hypothetical protein CUJ84_Chr002781 [Rhizobium leguminosarum]
MIGGHAPFCGVLARDPFVNKITLMDALPASTTHAPRLRPAVPGNTVTLVTPPIRFPMRNYLRPMRDEPGFQAREIALMRR